MSNLPLKPLRWTQNNYAGIITHTSKSPLHDYTIRYDELERAYLIDYYERMTNEHGCEFFKSVDEAKNWAQSTHYPSKMQPYVKPMPTWIDASERLPEDKEKYLVLTECGKVWTGHYGLVSKNPNEWYLHGYTVKQGWHPYEVTHWMPIPEFSTMQNLHKGE